MKGIREIAITDMPEVSIGNVQSDEAKTGVTVLLFDKKGAVVGVDISGGGPASRETPLTSPVTADNPINAIVLSGRIRLWIGSSRRCDALPGRPRNRV